MWSHGPCKSQAQAHMVNRTHERCLIKNGCLFSCSAHGDHTWMSLWNEINWQGWKNDTR